MKQLLIIFIAITFFACDETKPKEGTQPAATTVVTDDSLTLSYDVQGGGDTTLLFLHGWGINKSYWDNQVNFFSPRYKVVTVDLAGFGFSDTTRNEFTFEQYANDVSRLITQLSLKNVVLIGHSMSGDIIIETAIKYPQEIIGLVGVDNFIGVGKPFTEAERKETDAYMRRFDSNFVKEVRDYAEVALFHPSTDTVIKDRVKNDMTSGSKRVALNTFKHLLVFGQQESEKLPLLKLRLNLLNSDAHAPDTAALTKSTGASYKIYPIHATGHYPMIEEPGEFNLILQQILNDISSGK